MKKVLLTIALILASMFAQASSNSNPGVYYGLVPTAGQWNSYFSTKLDYLPGIANSLSYWDGSGNFLTAAVSGDCTAVANVFTCLTSGGYSWASPPPSGVGSTTAVPMFATTLSSTGIQTVANGTAAAPSVVFLGAGTTGFYWANPGIGFSVGGSSVGTWTASGFAIVGNLTFVPSTSSTNAAYMVPWINATTQGTSGLENTTTGFTFNPSTGNLGVPGSIFSNGGAALNSNGQVTSTIVTGTQPFVVASTTPVNNLSIAGNAGTATVLANVAGGLTSNTTINDTITYTTGGITLASQTAAVGSMWHVHAYGTFVAVSSATTRNMQVAAFWGATQLTAITNVVLISAGQTTDWTVDFDLTASSTTAIWTTGQLGTDASTAIASNLWNTDNATPASTTVSSGAQTIDLRFSMSVAVATDQWVVQQVSMIRLK